MPINSPQPGTASRTLTRNHEHTEHPLHERHIVADLNKPDTLDGAFEGVTRVFTLAGYDDMPALAATMRAQGVEHVVLMTGSAPRASSAWTTRFPAT
ncbi:hypothetical protein ACU686_05400 [Yinghuangia aomiensis]